MTKPNDPKKLRDTLVADEAPTDPGSRSPFPSSLPAKLADGRPHTLANLVQAFARCEHPSEGESPAVVLEPDGSKVEIRWCGACGAVDLNQHGFGEWIRPGFAQAMGDGDQLAALAHGVQTRVDRLAALAKTAHASCTRLVSADRSERDQLLTLMRDFVDASEELEQFVRVTVGAL